MAWLGLAHYFYNKKSPKENSLHLNGGYHRYYIYKTSDRKFIALGALENKFWKRFCEIINAPKSVVSENEKPLYIIKKVQKLLVLKLVLFGRESFQMKKIFAVHWWKKLKIL